MHWIRCHNLKFKCHDYKNIQTDVAKKKIKRVSDWLEAFHGAHNLGL